MNKPDWKDAPEWANWLAGDADGTWYWFKDKPDFDIDCWVRGFLGSIKLEHAGDYEPIKIPQIALEERQ